VVLQLGCVVAVDRVGSREASRGRACRSPRNENWVWQGETSTHGNANKKSFGGCGLEKEKRTNDRREEKGLVCIW
jgi:hypothetical protein